MIFAILLKKLFFLLTYFNNIFNKLKIGWKVQTNFIGKLIQILLLRIKGNIPFCMYSKVNSRQITPL